MRGNPRRGRAGLAYHLWRWSVHRLDGSPLPACGSLTAVLTPATQPRVHRFRSRDPAKHVRRPDDSATRRQIGTVSALYSYSQS
jgi:hypothetical protein